jgi:catechol-2,3-dioxygenase
MVSEGLTMSESVSDYVGHGQLPAPDIGLAVPWYTETLGFKLLNANAECAWLKLPRGPLLYLRRAAACSAVSRLSRDGLPMPAFMFMTRDIHPLKERLESSQATIRWFRDEGFGWTIQFTDPFGNELGAYQSKS